jgi:protein required for attachment to host cells
MLQGACYLTRFLTYWAQNMSTSKLPHEARVLVADGRKALLLRNQGDELHLNLQLEQAFEAPSNPPTHDQGADVPGRAMMRGRRSAMEQTDWHSRAEKAFAHDVTARVDEICYREHVKALMVIAPPKALADLRAAFPDRLRSLVIGELDKDLTRHPIYDIERHLA